MVVVGRRLPAGVGGAAHDRDLEGPREHAPRVHHVLQVAVAAPARDRAVVHQRAGVRVAQRVDHDRGVQRRHVEFAELVRPHAGQVQFVRQVLDGHVVG